MNRSTNIEDSIIIDNIFGRNKYLKSKNYAILKATGNVIAIGINGSY